MNIFKSDTYDYLMFEFTFNYYHLQSYSIRYSPSWSFLNHKRTHTFLYFASNFEEINHLSINQISGKLRVFL